MQNPQGAQETDSPQCLVAICSQCEKKGVSMKGQVLSYRWRCYSMRPSLLLFQRMQQVTLPETNTAPPSFLLYHFQSKVFAVWSMYFVSKAGYLGRRNKSLKRKTKSSSHLHTTVFLYIFIYAIIWRKQMTIFFGGEPPSLRGGGGHCTASEGHSHWFRVTLAKRKKTTAAVQRLSLSTC